MIKEIIVVEGAHDRQRLESIFPGIDCIITNGSEVSNETIEAIKTAQKVRGVILFMDPDFPGKQITNFILEHVQGPKIAFINKKEAISRNHKKVGIEHASETAIKSALDGLFTIKTDSKSDVDHTDLIRWHLVGETNSQTKRQHLCEVLGIPPCNGKALLKWIIRLEISKSHIEEVIV